MLRRKEEHSMEFAHQFSFRPDCNNTADVPSFIPRTALSAIRFVSDLCGVDVQCFLSERSSQALPNSKELSAYTDFSLPIQTQELLQAPLCFLRSFVLHGYDWNFVIGCNQIRQNFLHEVRLCQHVFCTVPL